MGGAPSTAWINGSFVLQVVAHEMGHNFGLYHSHSLDCGSVPLGTGCTMDEYGDIVDNMGYSSYQTGTNLSVVAALSGPTQSVEADFTSVDNNLGPKFGLVLRYQDSHNYYLIHRVTGGSSRLYISKVVNGVQTDQANVSIANPTKNVAFHIKGRVSGSTLSLDFGVNSLHAAPETGPVFFFSPSLRERAGSLLESPRSHGTGAACLRHGRERLHGPPRDPAAPRARAPGAGARARGIAGEAPAGLRGRRR